MTVDTTPDGGERDLRELILIDEVFHQRKPLLAICRGHQLLNVALGGTLIVDIPTEVPGALNHGQMDKRSEVVHEVQLTGESLLSKITGKRRLGVNSTHHQAVGRVAELLQVTGRSRGWGGREYGIEAAGSQDASVPAGHAVPSRTVGGSLPGTPGDISCVHPSVCASAKKIMKGRILVVDDAEDIRDFTRNGVARHLRSSRSEERRGSEAVLFPGTAGRGPARPEAARCRRHRSPATD